MKPWLKKLSICFTLVIITYIIIQIIKSLDELVYRVVPYLVISSLLVLVLAIIWAGFDKKIIQDKKNRLVIITVLIALVGLVLTVFQAVLFYRQTLLIGDQTELLKRTSQPNRPEVLLFSSQLSTCYKMDGVYEKGGRVAVGVTNQGKASIPSMSITLLPKNYLNGCKEGKSEKINYAWVIENLTGLDYRWTWFQFFIDNKTVEKEDLKLGPNELSFMVRCSVCDVKEEIQNITICFYERDCQKECGDNYAGGSLVGKEDCRLSN